MPVYRDSEGKVIEEKTKLTGGADRQQPPVSRGSGGQGRDDIPTGDANKPPAPPGGGQRRDDLPTRKIEKIPPGDQASNSDEPTRIYTGARTPPSGGGDQGENYRPTTPLPGGEDIGDPIPSPVIETDGLDDPVVGWLVIVGGPGKGKALQLGYGYNAIGRGETARVKLNFGDNQISRGGHTIVTYDSRGRKFYVQHGEGTNLTYLNDEPVLIPIELPPLSHISIGSTVLRFVPLCGDAFDWQDTNGT